MIVMIPRSYYGLLLVYLVNKISRIFYNQEDKTFNTDDGKR